MSANDQIQSALLTDRAQLVDYFASGRTAARDRGIGTEHEKFVFRKSDGGLVSYSESGGIRDILRGLCTRFGWQPVFHGDDLIAARRGDEAVTLEPGGQLELSGGIKRTIGETERELRRHLSELVDVSEDALYFASWGLNPFDDLPAIEWVPKPRYGIMRRFLSSRGSLAHWMMKTTCTAQPNFDYTTESNAADMVALGTRLAPVVVALFANSPARAGVATGHESYRTEIWRHTDPARTGTPPFFLERGWGFGEYVDWVIDVPMFFLFRDGQHLELEGQTFREFWQAGAGTHRAHIDDFEVHLSTVFPDVRMKKFVEVRSADCGSVDMILALSALFLGLYYDDASLEAGLALNEVSPEEHTRMMLEAGQNGLASKAYDFVALGQEMVRLSMEGLERIAAADATACDAPYLKPLLEILSTRTSQAARLAEGMFVDQLPRLELIARHQMNSEASMMAPASETANEDGQ